MSVATEISRARKRPMDPAKMRELLAKLRKGATATLSFGKLLQVLEHLGWELVPVLGWTPRHYPYQDKEHLPVADTIRLSREQLYEKHAELKAAESDTLPNEPKEVGEVVVMDVGPIIQGAAHRDDFVRYFYWREWVATDGLGLASPRGESAVFLPDHHDLDRGDRSLVDGGSSSVHDVWTWCWKHGAEEDVSGALGVETHVPAAERTRENTGTCAACWGNYKLSEAAHDEDRALVLHGYQRPGYGFLKGSCFGAGARPLETSDQGARDYADFLEKNLHQQAALLSRLKKGDVESVAGYGGRVVKRGEPSFEVLLARAVDHTKHTVDELKRDLDLYGRVLRDWEPRPMPREGELQRGPGFFLSKPAR